MKLEQVLDYPTGYVFIHSLCNEIFTKRTVKTVLVRYEDRVKNPYAKSKITREIEKKYAGKVIVFEDNFIMKDHTDDRIKIFTERFPSFLYPISATNLKLDDSGNEKPHSTSCEYARDDTCICWCNYKYHGIGRF